MTSTVWAVRELSDLGQRPLNRAWPIQCDGATAIRIEFATALRASALSLWLVWGAVLASAAQTAGKPAEQTGDPAVEQPLDEVDPGQTVSDAVIDIAAWAIASGDNLGHPFAIVDKSAAQLVVFGADGKVRGLAPALIGSAVGDHSAPGVGDRELSNIPLKDRTTPAGRFIAAFGPAVGGETVLWVDYDTAVSIHPTPDTDISRKEKRAERLASPTPDDNRISHGCINVSPAFYAKIVAPAFKKGGVFYVLPDSLPLKKAFPGFQPPGHLGSSTEVE